MKHANRDLSFGLAAAVMLLAMLQPLPTRGEILIDFSPDTVGGTTGTSFFNEIGVQVISDYFILPEDAVLTGASIYSQARYPIDGVGTPVHFRIYQGTIPGPLLNTDPIIDIPTQIDVIDGHGATSLSPGNPHTRKYASIPDTPLPAGTYWFAMPSAFGESDVRQSASSSSPHDDNTHAFGPDQLTTLFNLGDTWFQIEGRYEPGSGGGGDNGGGDNGGGDNGGGDNGGGGPGGGGNDVVPRPPAPSPRNDVPFPDRDLWGANAIAQYQEINLTDPKLFGNPRLGFVSTTAEAVAPADGSRGSTNNQSFAIAQAVSGIPFSGFLADAPVVTARTESFSGPSEFQPGQVVEGSKAFARASAVDFFVIGSTNASSEPQFDVDIDLQLGVGGSLRFTGEPGEGYAMVFVEAGFQAPGMSKGLFRATATWDGQELIRTAESGISDWIDPSYSVAFTTNGDTVEIAFALDYEDLAFVNEGDEIGLYLSIRTETFVKEGTNAIAHADFYDTVTGGFQTDHPNAGFRSIPEPSTAAIMLGIGGLLLRRRSGGLR